MKQVNFKWDETNTYIFADFLDEDGNVVLTWDVPYDTNLTQVVTNWLITDNLPEPIRFMERCPHCNSVHIGINYCGRCGKKLKKED